MCTTSAKQTLSFAKDWRSSTSQNCFQKMPRKKKQCLSLFKFEISKTNSAPLFGILGPSSITLLPPLRHPTADRHLRRRLSLSAIFQSGKKLGKKDPRANIFKKAIWMILIAWDSSDAIDIIHLTVKEYVQLNPWVCLLQLPLRWWKESWNGYPIRSCWRTFQDWRVRRTSGSLCVSCVSFSYDETMGVLQRKHVLLFLALSCATHMARLRAKGHYSVYWKAFWGYHDPFVWMIQCHHDPSSQILVLPHPCRCLIPINMGVSPWSGGACGSWAWMRTGPFAPWHGVGPHDENTMANFVGTITILYMHGLRQVQMAEAFDPSSTERREALQVHGKATWFWNSKTISFIMETIQSLLKPSWCTQNMHFPH